VKDKEFPLYDLSPEDFEIMCFELLVKRNVYFQLRRTINTTDTKVADIVGIYEDFDSSIKNIAIEIKHWMHFNVNKFVDDLEKRLDFLNDYRTYLFITSAKVSAKQYEEIKNICNNTSNIIIQVQDYSYICNLLLKYPEIGSKYFSSLRVALIKKRITTFISLLSIAVSIISIFSLIRKDQFKERELTLNSNISNVESALKSMKNLEKSLYRIKDEMKNTQKASQIIKEEYERAQVLKTLTNEQIKAVNMAVTNKGWISTLWNYAIGFILGIASSYIASLISDWLKKRRQLN
jgi:hypothetical protein